MASFCANNNCYKKRTLFMLWSLPINSYIVLWCFRGFFYLCLLFISYLTIKEELSLKRYGVIWWMGVETEKCMTQHKYGSIFKWLYLNHSIELKFVFSLLIFHHLNIYFYICHNSTCNICISATKEEA